MRGVGTFLIVTLLTLTSAAASELARDSARAATSPSSPHIRPLTDRLAAALVDGTERSATLRSLVAQLEASDVIVYLQVQHALRGRFSGTLTWVSSAAGVRYVLVSLNPDLPTYALIAAIGHELQHALEVAGAQSVVDTSTLSDLYRRIGTKRRPHLDQWETEMALQVGERVRLELTTTMVTSVAQSIQPAVITDGFVIDERE